MDDGDRDANAKASVLHIECDICNEFAQIAWDNSEKLDEIGIEAVVEEICGPGNQVPKSALLFDVKLDDDREFAELIPTGKPGQILRMDWQTTAMKTACHRTLGTIELELAETIYEGRSKREHSKVLLKQAMKRMQAELCDPFCEKGGNVLATKPDGELTHFAALRDPPSKRQNAADDPLENAEISAAEAELKAAQEKVAQLKAQKDQKKAGKAEAKKKAAEMKMSPEEEEKRDEAREKSRLRKKEKDAKKRKEKHLERARSGMDSVGDSMTPEQQLRLAMEADDVVGMQAALDRGADIDHHEEGNNGGQTTLMQAVLGIKNLSVQFLIDQGADCTIGEASGYTPMHGAGFKGNAEAVHILFEAGCDPSEMGADGFTPIHRACWGGEKEHTATVKAYLEVGVPVDEQATDGRGPDQMFLRNQLDVPNPDTKILLDEWRSKEGKQEL